MKIHKTIKGLLAAACIAAAGSASAASLNWSDAAFTNASQVNNVGTAVWAFNFGTTTDVTVNGVLFDGSVAGELEDSNGGAITEAPLIQWGSSDDQTGNSDAGYGTALGVTGLGAADEVNLLNSFTWGNTQGIGFELRGLSIGQEYTIQALVVDNRGSFTGRQLHFEPDGTAWGQLPLVDYTSNGSPAYARIVEATFTADGTTQAFRTGIQGTGEIHFNALQLRAVPEPSSLAFLGLGGLLMLRRNSAQVARRRRN